MEQASMTELSAAVGLTALLAQVSQSLNGECITRMVLWNGGGTRVRNRVNFGTDWNGRGATLPVTEVGLA
jgi:hypothetical protein